MLLDGGHPTSRIGIANIDDRSGLMHHHAYSHHEQDRGVYFHKQDSHQRQADRSKLNEMEKRLLRPTRQFNLRRPMTGPIGDSGEQPDRDYDIHEKGLKQHGRRHGWPSNDPVEGPFPAQLRPSWSHDMSGAKIAFLMLLASRDGQPVALVRLMTDETDGHVDITLLTRSTRRLSPIVHRLAPPLTRAT